jgi:dihydropteroate synthase
MGIVNATPDSFSDGGRALLLDDAVSLAARLVDEGADLLDIGGESSRPRAEPVSREEELRRVVPVIEAVAGATTVPLSVDTSKAAVARRAIEAGASVINDITALTGDPEMARLAADSDAGVVIMHMLGRPRTMQENPQYRNVVEEVYEYLARRAEALVALGIGASRIAIDPGIGFGKTREHNLELLRNVGRFASLGYALVIGTSRKRFLGELTGRSVGERATASAVSALAAVVQGAGVVRVHDVAATVDAIKVWSALRDWCNGHEPGSR